MNVQEVSSARRAFSGEAPSWSLAKRRKLLQQEAASLADQERTRVGRPVIAIAAVGAIPRDSLEALVPEIAAAFHCEVKVVAAVRLPARALDRRRGQYLAVEILDVLERARRPAWERLLGVADVDLWAEGLNFVFGEADPAAGVAVMSLARLAASDLAVFRRRAAVEAIHEIGHTYGLGHCRDPRCVMWFSNTLAETDRKGARFCAAHARHLASLR